MSNMIKYVLLFIFTTIHVIHSVKEGNIHDPLNIFCGSLSCYDVLDVERSASLKDIKKAYRKLALAQHPDKSRESNATEVFRMISKASEVLENNESRSLFDYYLDHPRDYFKVSGTHYYRNLPKSDVRMVLIIVVLLISLFQYHYQNSKYQRVVKYLYTATLNNHNEKQGGSRQTIELYQRAVEDYDVEINHGKSSADKVSINKNKLAKDPIFEKLVKKIVSEVKIEGGYRKPKWSETLAVQLFYLPWIIYRYAKQYHRRHISTAPFTEEEKEEMTIEVVGLGLWNEELNDVDKKKLIALDLWKASNRQQWEEYGLELLLDEKELNELKAARAAAAGSDERDSSSSTTKSRKKIAKKPKPTK